MPKPKPRKKRRNQPPRRSGSLSKAEKAVIAHVVTDSPAEITQRQVIALAQTLRRRPEAIRDAIVEARDNFNAEANFYVETHKKVVETAVANGDPKSLEVARKGSAWALTNMSHEGKRVVDKPDVGPVGSKIVVGIAIGGIKQEGIQALPLIEATTTESDV